MLTISYRPFILVVIALSLCSCIFIKGVPMHSEDEDDTETWPLTLLEKMPYSGYSEFSPDYSLAFTFSNSFDPARFGRVTLQSPLLELNEFNSFMTYATKVYTNDTLIIKPHTALSISTDYSSISFSGFFDFKGNPVDSINDSSYTFRTAASMGPIVLQYTPYSGSKRVTPYLSFRVRFNEPLDSVLNGTLSLDGPVNITFTNGSNCTMNLTKSMVDGDTLVVIPNSPLAANKYRGLSISGFDDINGNLMSAYNDPAYSLDIAGLCAEYPLNNSFNDITTNSYHAVELNGVMYAPDRYNLTVNAAGFDGVDSYLNCPGLTDFGDQSGDFTIMLWLYPDTLPAGNCSFLSKDTNDLVNNPGTSEIQLDIFNRRTIRAMIGNPVNDTSFTQLRGITLINANIWYHVAVTAAGKEMKLYINGIKEAEAFGERNFSSTFPLVLGKSDDAEGGAPTFFNGRLDEVKVYNRPLSDNEIKNIYNNEKL